jgi:hypothetical protein
VDGRKFVLILVSHIVNCAVITPGQEITRYLHIWKLKCFFDITNSITVDSTDDLTLICCYIDGQNTKCSEK